MLNNVLKYKNYCGLDIGSQSVKAALIRVDNNSSPKILGVNEIKTSGFKKGSVSNLGDLSEIISSCISDLGKKSGTKIKTVVLGISSDLIISRYCSAVVPILDKGSKIINNYDIKKVQSQARLLGGNIDEEVIHNIPQYYKVDDSNIAMNPSGLFGRKLEINTMFITANSLLIKNLTQAVYQAGYDVENMFFTSLAASEVSLNDYHKRQGCILIDIGSANTNILIFKDGHLRCLYTIPIGGENVSKKIAKKLNLAFDLADNIKKSYATAINSDSRNKEEILIKREEGYSSVKKAEISKAIQPEVSKLINQIIEFLKGSEFYNQINSGIIMVGGGCLLPGLAERIEEETNFKVKIGSTQISTDKWYKSAIFCAAVGLVHMGLNNTYMISSPLHGRSIKFLNIVNYMKELYSEYF